MQCIPRPSLFSSSFQKKNNKIIISEGGSVNSFVFISTQAEILEVPAEQ